MVSTQNLFNRSETNFGTSTLTSNATGGGGANENKPPFVGVHFIIKAL